MSTAKASTPSRARAAIDLGRPKGVGVGIGGFCVQAGDEVVGQRCPIFGGQAQHAGTQLSRGHGGYSATVRGRSSSSCKLRNSPAIGDPIGSFVMAEFCRAFAMKSHFGAVFCG
jgi:hypothetical protein